MIKREIIDQILDAIYQIRTKIFKNADVDACCRLYEGLNMLCGDLAVMKAVMNPELAEDEREPLVLDIDIESQA